MLDCVIHKIHSITRLRARTFHRERAPPPKPRAPPPQFGWRLGGPLWGAEPTKRWTKKVADLAVTKIVAWRKLLKFSSCAGYHRAGHHRARISPQNMTSK